MFDEESLMGSFLKIFSFSGMENIGSTIVHAFVIT